MTKNALSMAHIYPPVSTKGFSWLHFEKVVLSITNTILSFLAHCNVHTEKLLQCSQEVTTVTKHLCSFHNISLFVNMAIGTAIIVYAQ